MTADTEEAKQTGRIEGGIDAIVLGASADGLAAAAYLGRAGLRTVLLESGAEIGGYLRRRDFAEGVSGIDGEHLISLLDPELLTDLDLYRHGVEYAARRLDSVYFFDRFEPIKLDGDLREAANLLPDELEEREELGAFLEEMLDLAAFLRPAFESIPAHSARLLEKAFAQAPAHVSKRIARYAGASVEDVLGARFEEGAVKTLLSSEASFRSGVGPNEPFSFMHYVRRLAGEASGLQAAAAYCKGGAATVIDALRRAAQAAKVEIRAATPVRSVLIEGDRVAGVMLESGGQLRAPIVISAVDAAQTFLDMIGPQAIDIEFQRILTPPDAAVASARLQLVLKGVAKDEATKENMTRRLVYAPSPDALRVAFIEARAGRIPDDLIIEAVFPDALDAQEKAENKQILSLIAHPLPFDEKPDEKRRDAIRKAIMANVGKFAPGIEKRLIAADLSLPCDLAQRAGAAKPVVYAAKPSIMRQWAIAGVTARTNNVAGLYFCGPEAQIGSGLSCAAARVAAKSAIRDMKKGMTGS